MSLPSTLSLSHTHIRPLFHTQIFEFFLENNLNWNKKKTMRKAAFKIIFFFCCARWTDLEVKSFCFFLFLVFCFVFCFYQHAATATWRQRHVIATFTDYRLPITDYRSPITHTCGFLFFFLFFTFNVQRHSAAEPSDLSMFSLFLFSFLHDFYIIFLIYFTLL